MKKILDYHVVDGDTVNVTLDMGLGIQYATKVRLHGIDAPETRTRDPEERKRGKAAKAKLSEWMAAAESLECEVIERRSKYGRLIGNIIADGVNLNERLLNEQYAEAYK